VRLVSTESPHQGAGASVAGPSSSLLTPSFFEGKRKEET
jgi:hypothetical protein